MKKNTKPQLKNNQVKRNFNQQVKPVQKKLYEKINQWIKKHDWYFIGIGLCLAAIFGTLLLKPFINEMGDDTAYIERAFNFLYERQFPGFQGALYPMFLSLIILISGINVIVLKSFSLVFLLLSIFFLFLAFRKQIDAVLNIFIVFMSCFSGILLLYGGETFSETFYMGIQSMAIFVFVKYYVGQSPGSTRKQIMGALWMGLLVFMASITRHIGIVFLPAVIITLLCYKQWKDAVFNAVSFVFYYSIFAVLKNLIYGIPFIEKSGQATILMQKSPYNSGDGMENLMGFVSRLFENANFYISKCFYQFTHLRVNAETTQPLVWLTVITVIIWLVALWKALQKKDKTTTLIALYAAFFLGGTFLILQTFWKQDRLVLPVFPLTFFLFVYAFSTVMNWKKRTAFSILGLIFMVSLVFISLGDVLLKSQDRTAAKAYFKGDRVHVYTSDWKNYLLMSQWAADNTPDSCKIAARKSSMSNIFSGKFKFCGIYSVPTISYEDTPETPDSCLAMIMIPQIVNSYTPEFSKSIVAVIHTKEKITLGNTEPTANVLGLYHVPKSTEQNFARLRAMRFPFEEDANRWINEHALKDSVSFYSPENLYQNMKKKHVNYVLMANIRLNIKDPNSSIISTVNRYMFYITCKYPNFMGASIHTIGTKNQADLHPVIYD